MQHATNKARVFVSSTIYDLGDLRSALRFWLEELGLEVRMSEFNDFFRKPEQDAFDSCFSAIEGCDYYILLVGGRKGSEYVPGVSVTQQEYRTAVELARQGKIKPIIFIRAEVATALHQRERILDDLDKAGADPATSATASAAGGGALEDPEFIASFVNEIRQTELARHGEQGPAGKMWYYQFSDFGDVVAALRVNMRLYGSVRREALLANLKWELEENIGSLCHKAKGELPEPHYFRLSTVRREVKLTADSALAGIVELDSGQAYRVVTFWILSSAAAWLRTTSLRDAIGSGEFLVYDQATGRLIAGPVQLAMQSLRKAVELYGRALDYLPKYGPRRDEMIAEVVQKQAVVQVPADMLVSLFVAHDRMMDIFRISVALLRHIVEPSVEIRQPALSPITPLEDQIEGLQQQNATHEDVERWARDGYLWSFITGEPVAGAEDLQGAFERYPRLREIVERGIEQEVKRILRQYGPEIARRRESEGDDAAAAWLKSVMNEEGFRGSS